MVEVGRRAVARRTACTAPIAIVVGRVGVVVVVEIVKVVVVRVGCSAEAR